MVRRFAVFLLLILPAYYGLVLLYIVSPLFWESAPLNITVTTDRDHPDYVFFLVNWSGTPRFGRPPVERLSVSAADPVRIEPDGRIGGYRDWTLHAVPAGLLNPPGGSTPTDCSWFTHPERRGEVGSLETFDFGSHSLPFYDDRQRVDVTYRLERDTGGWRLAKVAENAGSPWAKWGRIGAAALVPVALTGFGLRWVFRGPS